MRRFSSWTYRILCTTENVEQSKDKVTTQYANQECGTNNFEEQFMEAEVASYLPDKSKGTTSEETKSEETKSEETKGELVVLKSAFEFSP